MLSPDTVKGLSKVATRLKRVGAVKVGKVARFVKSGALKNSANNFVKNEVKEETVIQAKLGNMKKNAKAAGVNPSTYNKVSNTAYGIVRSSGPTYTKPSKITTLKSYKNRGGIIRWRRVK